jgi:hypothetical protein
MTHALGPARAWKNQFQARIIAAVALFQTQQTRILRLVKQGGRQRAFLRANNHKTQVFVWVTVAPTKVAPERQSHLTRINLVFDVCCREK